MTILVFIAVLQVALSLWFAFTNEWSRAIYMAIWFSISLQLSYAQIILDKLNQIN